MRIGDFRILVVGFSLFLSVPSFADDDLKKYNCDPDNPQSIIDALKASPMRHYVVVNGDGASGRYKPLTAAMLSDIEVRKQICVEFEINMKDYKEAILDEPKRWEELQDFVTKRLHTYAWGDLSSKDQENRFCKEYRNLWIRIVKFQKDNPGREDYWTSEIVPAPAQYVRDLETDYELRLKNKQIARPEFERAKVQNEFMQSRLYQILESVHKNAASAPVGGAKKIRMPSEESNERLNRLHQLVDKYSKQGMNDKQASEKAHQQVNKEFGEDKRGGTGPTPVIVPKQEDKKDSAPSEPKEKKDGKSGKNSKELYKPDVPKKQQLTEDQAVQHFSDRIDWTSPIDYFTKVPATMAAWVTVKIFGVPDQKDEPEKFSQGKYQEYKSDESKDNKTPGFRTQTIQPK